MFLFVLFILLILSPVLVFLFWLVCVILAIFD